MKHPEYLVDIAENMEKVRDGGQALAIRNSGVNLFDKNEAAVYSNWVYDTGGYYSFKVFVGKGSTVTVSYKQDLVVNMDCPYTIIVFDYANDSDDIWIYHKTVGGCINKTVTGVAAEDYIYVRSNVWNIDELLKFFQYIGNDLQIEIVSAPFTDTLTNRGHRLMPEMNEILSNMNDIYQAGQESAAALKTSVSGAAIAVSDVNEIEHNVGVQLKSKNLFDVNLDPHSIHYAVRLVSLNDGELTIKQNYNTTFASYNIAIPNANNLVGKTITISCDCKVGEGGNNTTVRVLWLNSNGGAIAGKGILYTPYVSSTEYQHISVSGVVDAQPDESHDTLALMFYGNVTRTLSDGEYYAYFKNIQIELGTAATEYMPYIGDFTSVNSSKNLLDPRNYVDTSNQGTVDILDDCLVVLGGGLDMENGGTYAEITYNFIVTEPCVLTLWSKHEYYGWTAGVYLNDTLLNLMGETTISVPLSVGTYTLKLFQGEQSTSGTYIQLEKGTTPTDYEPYREPIAAEVSRYGKNLFDIDTVLPSFINNYGEAFKWEKQSDGSYYKGNVGTGYGDVWFENKANYKGQIAISIASKHTITEVGGFGLTLELEYTDGTKKTVIYTPMLSETYSVKTFVTDANKTVFRITQSYNNGKGMYVKDIMIAYGTDTTYEPYIEPTTYTAKADGTVERLKYGKNLALAEDVYKGNHKYAIVEFEGRKAVRFIDSETALWNGISFKPNTQYTVSFDARVAEWNSITTDVSGLFCFTYSDGQRSWIISNRNTEWEHFTLTSKAGKTVVAVGIASYNYQNMNYIDCNSFQLEEGSTATPYEPYQEPVIEGVKSISPNMTLLSNTSGVIIDAEYFKQG